MITKLKLQKLKKCWGNDSAIRALKIPPSNLKFNLDIESCVLNVIQEETTKFLANPGIEKSKRLRLYPACNIESSDLTELNTWRDSSFASLGIFYAMKIRPVVPSEAFDIDYVDVLFGGHFPDISALFNVHISVYNTNEGYTLCYDIKDSIPDVIAKVIREKGIVYKINK